MSQHIATANSGANAAATLTITAPKVNNNSSTVKKILIHSITVTTSGGDIAADIGILLTKVSSGETWNAELRSAKVFGGHFPFSHAIDCGHGNVTITTDAGGASVIVTTSVQYEVI
jgi:hypothetical protein